VGKICAEWVRKVERAEPDRARTGLAAWPGFCAQHAAEGGGVM
jgi:hypothetical protein